MGSGIAVGTSAAKWADDFVRFITPIETLQRRWQQAVSAQLLRGRALATGWPLADDGLLHAAAGKVTPTQASGVGSGGGAPFD